MAKRPVFIPAPDLPELVKTAWFDLKWAPGFAASQKARNIRALHEAAADAGLSPLLEISTKGDEKVGRHLSAFHLRVKRGDRWTPLESVFQGSKVFEQGGPYRDLYDLEPRKAKLDPRVRSSGGIIAFDFDGVLYPTEPRTFFYDWLYLNAMSEHREWLTRRLRHYAGFTDIEFNPERSLNCQARSCALFVALSRTGELQDALQSPNSFVDLLQRRIRVGTHHPTPDPGS